MWRLTIASLLVTGANAFTQLQKAYTAPLLWSPSSRTSSSQAFSSSGYVLVPEDTEGSSTESHTPMPLTIRNSHREDMSPATIPHFAAQADGKITFGNTASLCLDASGRNIGDAVRVNSCNDGPTQKWNWVPDGHGQTLIQLQETNACLDVAQNSFRGAQPRVELRECNFEGTDTWKFEDAAPLPQQSSSFLLHVLISSLVLGAMSLSAWLWQRQRKAQAVITSLNEARTPEQAGVTLTAPLASWQGKSQSMVPAIMAASPTSDKPSLMPGDNFNSQSPEAGNYGRLSDKLKRADIERRKAEEAAYQRENAERLAREAKQRKIEHMRNTPEDAKAGTIEDFMYKDGVKEILERLDYDLIGLQSVKECVREIAALLVVDKMRTKLGFETGVPSLHMMFTGSPGTGKTTVALRLGEILRAMGYCRVGHVVVATRDDLVGQYVGHTAPKTKEMVKKAMGGILLVDEAYYLYNAANDRDYGQESIEILLSVMEKHTEDLVVVLAGYQDKMEKFLGYIPGMSSRIGNQINFPDYGSDELIEIAKVMARELEYEIKEEAFPVLKEYLEKRKQLPFFANARTVRNAVDRARLRAATRLFDEKTAPNSDGNVTEEELSFLTAADFEDIGDDSLTGKTEEANDASSAAEQFTAHAGYISAGGDLFQGNMTVAQAQIEAKEQGGGKCLGFCHPGPPTASVVPIYFKTHSQIIDDPNDQWTSYI